MDFFFFFLIFVSFGTLFDFCDWLDTVGGQWKGKGQTVSYDTSGLCYLLCNCCILFWGFMLLPNTLVSQDPSMENLQHLCSYCSLEFLALVDI